MSRVLTFSTQFPAKHPRASEPTHFVEQIWNSLRELNLPLPKNADFTEEFMWTILPLSNFGCKYHTIRSGKRWKVGDKFSPRVWSGKPYQSKQIIIAPDIEIRQVWDIEIEFNGSNIHILNPTGKPNEYMFLRLSEVARNDGLSVQDFKDWFAIHPKSKNQKFEGQIICWSDRVEY